MYKYNPMNMLRTVFSQYATDAEGRISVRRHEYSLMYVVFFIYIHFGQNISWNWFLFWYLLFRYDPIQSTTKEMKILLTFGYGSKTEEGGPLVYNQVCSALFTSKKKLWFNFPLFSRIFLTGRFHCFWNVLLFSRNSTLSTRSKFSVKSNRKRLLMTNPNQFWKPWRKSFQSLTKWFLFQLSQLLRSNFF